MKNKNIKLGLILVLGLSALSFISSVQGCATINRSLDDWLYQMDRQTPLNDYIGAWNLGELIVWPHFSFEEGFISTLDCDYHGHILEREMSDGRHMITVQIHVKGAPVTVETSDSVNYAVLFDGEMNYLFQLKFIVDLTIWPQYLLHVDDDGFHNDTGYVGLPAYAVLSIGYLWGLDFGVEFVSVLFIGNAKGVMVNDWNGLVIGDNAKLKVATISFVNRGYIPFIEPFLPTWSLDYLKLY